MTIHKDIVPTFEGSCQATRTSEGAKFLGDVMSVPYVGGDIEPEPSAGASRVASSALRAAWTKKERKYAAASEEGPNPD